MNTTDFEKALYVYQSIINNIKKHITKAMLKDKFSRNMELGIC